jgi:hypothetical protein
MPWVQPIWNYMPHIYNPLPDIFFERLKGREGNITTPAILRGNNGDIIRVLTRKETIDDVAIEVCGPGGNFQSNSSKGGLPEISITEKGFSYVTGRFTCKLKIPVVFSFTKESLNRPQKLIGMSHAEKYGTWTVGKRSVITLPVVVDEVGKVSIRFKGLVFVNELHLEQEVKIKIGDQQYNSWTISHPNRNFNKLVQVNSNALQNVDGVKIELGFPDSISPEQLGLSKDDRNLGMSIQDISIEKIE